MVSVSSLSLHPRSFCLPGLPSPWISLGNSLHFVLCFFTSPQTLSSYTWFLAPPSTQSSSTASMIQSSPSHVQCLLSPCHTLRLSLHNTGWRGHLPLLALLSPWSSVMVALWWDIVSLFLMCSLCFPQSFQYVGSLRSVLSLHLLFVFSSFLLAQTQIVLLYKALSGVEKLALVSRGDKWQKACHYWYHLLRSFCPFNINPSTACSQPSTLILDK
jgi:hypothetical protein